MIYCPFCRLLLCLAFLFSAFYDISQHEKTQFPRKSAESRRESNSHMDVQAGFPNQKRKNFVGVAGGVTRPAGHFQTKQP